MTIFVYVKLKRYTVEITFDKKYLSDLYYRGKCADKKHRFQPEIVRKYIRVIDILKSTTVVEDLFRLRSLNYEALSGDKNGIESVRVNDKYRIEFRTSKVVDETVVTICNILELSNHYK